MPPRLLPHCVLPMLLVLATGVQAGVYKCEAADGQVTYSDKPCMEGKSSEVRIRTSSGLGPSSSSTPGLTESAVDGLDCSTAVSNGREWLESMRSVGKRNLETGHMSSEEYNSGMRQLNEMAGNITVGKCQGSSGQTRKFFECLGDISNHLARCGQRYQPDF